MGWKTNSIHWETLNPISKCHCSDNQAEKNKVSSENKSPSENDSDEGLHSEENSYVVDKIVPHIGFCSRLQHVAQWYGYSKVEILQNYSTKYRNTLSMLIGRELTSGERERPYWDRLGRRHAFSTFPPLTFLYLSITYMYWIWLAVRNTADNLRTRARLS